MRFNVFSLPLAMVIAIVLAASVALAATSSPIPEFSTDVSSIYMGSPSYSGNIVVTRNSSYDNISLTIDSINVADGLGQVISVAPGSSPILINSTSPSGTIAMTATVAGKTAGHYTGTVVIKNTTNPANSNVSVAATLDMPMIFSSGISSTLVNMSGNTTILFNASNVSGSKGIYIISNNTSTSITLKKSGSTVETGTGNLTYFSYASGITGDHVIELSGTGVVNLMVWLIPFDLSDAVIKNSDGSGEAQNKSETFNTTSVRNLTLTLNNTGGYSYNVAFVSDSSLLKLSTGNMSFTHNLGASHALTTDDVEVQYTMGANANQQGVYTGSIKFNLEKSGLTVPINVTLEVSALNQLNVTILSVADLADSDFVINDTNARLRVNADVKYLNGTRVSDLTSVNNYFSVNLTTYYGSASKTRAATVENTSLSIPDPYGLNVSVADADYGGNFTVFLTATDTKGNSGTSNSMIYVNESFFVITAEAASCSGAAECNGDAVNDGEGDDTFYIKLDVKNYGYKSATDVEVVLDTGDCVSLIDGGEWDTDDSEYVLGAINSGANKTYARAWKIELQSEGDCDVTISGESHTSATWAGDEKIDVEVVSSGITPDEGGSPQVSGELSLYSFPTTTTVAAGSSKTIQVKVRNTLDADLTNVKLYVDYIDPDWYTGPYVKNIDSGEIAIYDVTFNIPADADVKNYSIKFVTNTTAVVDRESVILMVLGFGIDVSPDVALEGYNIRYDVLDELYNEALDQGKNVTEIGETLTEVKILIDQANAYMDDGETADAEELYEQIEDLLTQAEDSLGAIKMQQLGQIAAGSFWPVVIIAALVFAGLVYIARKPTGGYTHGRGYSYVPEHHRGKSILDRIKEKIDRAKKFNAI